MRHLASPSFWELYERLPGSIKDLARKNFDLLKQNPQHPPLHFKNIGRFRSVRIGQHYRALAVEVDVGILWFWIGTHAQYDRLIK